jgi:predicted CoA-binding protein
MHEHTVIEKLEDLQTLLEGVRTIAVVGLSPDPARDSYTIAAYLQGSGYRIVGVNPGVQDVLGEPCYPSLSRIPVGLRQKIDLVAVFRRRDAVPPILEECASLGLRMVWLQIGVSSPAALEAANRLGLTLVANKCLRVVHGLIRDELSVPEGRR